MAKFNRATPSPQGRTHEGAPGYQRDTRTELFLLAVSSMVGEHTFYEAADERDERFRTLVARLAVDDVEWLAQLLTWLRKEANLRSAPLVGALEAARARLGAGAHGHSRQLVSAALGRADEPGEALAYWTGRYGRSLPKPVKRGVADAVTRLYSQRSLLKYDTDSHAFRFGDVCDLTHPTARDPRQGALFAHALDRRHNRANAIPTELGVLRAREELMALPVAERRALLDRPDAAEVLARAGMTWEALAGWLQGPMDAGAWETVIPSIGYMAQLRNLRNFDQAGVSDEVAERVAARLADPDEVARSRQFPMRFLAAYRAAPSLRWGAALERALGHALGNVPELAGRTLVLVDQSGSMRGRMSARSELSNAQVAQIFGAALAMRCEHADLVQFDNVSEPVRLGRGDALLRVLDRFWGGRGGTETAEAVRQHYRDHDRVVLVSDEQTWGGRRGEEPTRAVPARVPVYTWNLAGYRYGHGPVGTGNRYVFGGLSDAAFRMIPLIEAGEDRRWPWETEAAAA
ncbi:TROVE domain-containing protein [Halostreptopolyspora alba]|uniref:TROVE domain-containing protein n=1 Tax=Halostreptopolyspora alba TaxID=2487137 RepID=A0A3N0ECE0_9ACTN|nr:TROVE domain-containing protein [Nocardiopsaceae bacterium YIM 96095]